MHIEAYTGIKIIALLLGFFLQKTPKIFLVFLGMSIIFEMVISNNNTSIRMNTLLNYYFVLLNSFFLLFFLNGVVDKWPGKYILVSVGVFLGIGIMSKMDHEGTVYVFSAFVGMGIVVISIFHYFYDKFYENVASDLFSQREFWLGVGILIFYAGVFNYLMSYLLLSEQDSITHEIFHQVIYSNFILSILFLFVILCPYKKIIYRF